MVIWDASEAELADFKPIADLKLFFSIPGVVRRIRAEGTSAGAVIKTPVPVQAPIKRRLDLRRPLTFRPAWT